MRRKIIEIDREKCDGCGLCVPDCPEGAIQMIDGKATLVSDLFCDGLGACLGTCPIGAITIVEREAQAYDESRVMEHIIKQGPNVVKAHLLHLKEHGEDAYLAQAMETLAKNGQPKPDLEAHRHQGCPGSAMRDLSGPKTRRQGSDIMEAHRKQTDAAGSQSDTSTTEPAVGTLQSELTQWPIQLHLANPHAPYFKDCDLLVCADCVPFAYADFHRKYLKDHKLLIMCPKLDEGMDRYVEKLTVLFQSNNVKSLTVLHMQLPCCGGVRMVVEEALEKAGKKIEIRDITISLEGEEM